MNVNAMLTQYEGFNFGLEKLSYEKDLFTIYNDVPGRIDSSTSTSC
jgi:hypothetical protein